MTFPIDPKKSAQENLLALVNHANTSDLALTDVELSNLAMIEMAGEGVRNTSVQLVPKPEGRFNVAAGGVTVNYRRLSFAELITKPVEIKATRSTTLTEINQIICNAYGLIPDGVAILGDLPGNGTILPGETFEVTISPSTIGGLVYFPKAKQITITWDGEWLSTLITNTSPSGFAEVTQRKLLYSLTFEPGEPVKYTGIGGPRIGDYKGNRVLYGSDSAAVVGKKVGIEIGGVNRIDLSTIDFDLEFKYFNTTETSSAQAALCLGTGFGYCIIIGIVGASATIYGMPPGTASNPAPSYVKGAWNKLTVKRRGANLEVLVNDVSVVTATGGSGDSSIVQLLTGNLQFGTAEGLSAPYNNYSGHLDDLTIYKVG